MRAAKAQISLRIREVWSGPSLSANRVPLDTTECTNGEQRRPGRYFAQMQDDLNLRVWRMFQSTFSFDTARI